MSKIITQIEFLRSTVIFDVRSLSNKMKYNALKLIDA